MAEPGEIAGLRRDVQDLTGAVEALNATVRELRDLVEHTDAELSRQTARTDAVEQRLDDLPPNAVAAG